MRMHNPPHPGLALRVFLGDLTVTEAAQRLSVTRSTLSRILRGSAGISTNMALRLRDALGTSAEMWIAMQSQYDLWQAEKNLTQPSSQEAAMKTPHFTDKQIIGIVQQAEAGVPTSALSKAHGVSNAMLEKWIAQYSSTVAQRKTQKAADLAGILYKPGRPTVPIEKMRVTGRGALERTKKSGEVDSLRPPEGHMSWLDYAVDTIDVRSVQIQRAFADEPDIPAAAMRQAARIELDELRATVARLEALINDQTPRQSE